MRFGSCLLAVLVITGELVGKGFKIKLRLRFYTSLINYFIREQFAEANYS